MLTEIYVVIVFILSSFLQTATGFGYAIITAPLLAIALDPKETVMLTMVTSFIIMLIMSRAAKNEGSFKAIFTLITASIAGAIPGAYIMTIISNDGLKIFIGIVLLLAAFALWKNYRLSISNHKLAEAVAGGLSGFLATTTSIPGPPVILYYLNSGAEENKAAFRGNLARFFLLMSIASVIISYFAGTLKIEALYVRTLMSIPALYLGFYLGEKAFRRINVEAFRKALLGMVFASGLMLIFVTLFKQYS